MSAACIIPNCQRAAAAGEPLCAHHRAAEAWDKIHEGMRRFGMESGAIETVSEYFSTPSQGLDAATVERCAQVAEAAKRGSRANEAAVRAEIASAIRAQVQEVQ